MIIDRKLALDLLERAVDQRGQSFRYQHMEKVVTIAEEAEPVSVGGCWYELNDAPSCGVGVALHMAGVPLAVLDAMDQSPGDTSIHQVSGVLEDNGVQLTSDALWAFTRFQEAQDQDRNWGHALAEAKKED